MNEQSSSMDQNNSDASGQPDLTRSRPNPYAEKMKNGSNLVLIEPDVFEVFPSSEAVNNALRLLMKTAASLNRDKELPHAS